MKTTTFFGNVKRSYLVDWDLHPKARARYLTSVRIYASLSK
jgi:hypothetical protein